MLVRINSFILCIYCKCNGCSFVKFWNLTNGGCGADGRDNIQHIPSGL